MVWHDNLRNVRAQFLWNPWERRGDVAKKLRRCFDDAATTQRRRSDDAATTQRQGATILFVSAGRHLDRRHPAWESYGTGTSDALASAPTLHPGSSKG